MEVLNVPTQAVFDAFPDFSGFRFLENVLFIYLFFFSI